MSERIIYFNKVSKVYDRKWLGISDVTFEVNKGDFVSLVGPSGAGKSTILKLIYFAELPNTGKVEVLGYSAGDISAEIVVFLRRRIGVVFQDFRLLNEKNVFENVELPLIIRGIKKKKRRYRVAELLRSIGLAGKNKAFPHELSGGEQQRVAIARAMANQPLILLADEPTGNLDQATSQDIMELLLGINRMGTTVIMATHNMDLVNLLRGTLTMQGEQPHRSPILKLDSGRLVNTAGDRTSVGDD